ncbi:MAG: methyltransferase domain-containing protein [Candidatus Omnitrophota bacterium]|nr:methyltransferase domain-containing protein [Candidatus Omnitrophota bacterium]
MNARIKDTLKSIIPGHVRSMLRRIQFLIFSLIKRAYSRIFLGLKKGDLEGTHLLLHIGCGTLVKAGWINVDLDPGRGAFFLDATKGLPFGSGAVKHIHCEHFLEHLEYPAAKKFLQESYRVLERTGSIRIIVPDAEKYFKAYYEKDTSFFDKLKYLGGTAQPLRTNIEIVNQMFMMGGAHRFAWDFETLALMLHESGFSEVRKSAFGDISPELDIDGSDEWRLLESLYVTAFKRA